MTARLRVTMNIMLSQMQKDTKTVPELRSRLEKLGNIFLIDKVATRGRGMHTSSANFLAAAGFSTFLAPSASCLCLLASNLAESTRATPPPVVMYGVSRVPVLSLGKERLFPGSWWWTWDFCARRAVALARRTSICWSVKSPSKSLPSDRVDKSRTAAMLR